MKRVFLIVTLSTALARAADKIRVGYFPNITHAQAIVGLADGTFQKSLGPAVTIETKVFNAGPSAIPSWLPPRRDASVLPSPSTEPLR